MLAAANNTKGKGVNRNEGGISDERPIKTARMDEEGALVQQTQEETPGQGQGQAIPSNYGKMETFGMSRISMDFEGEAEHTLKQRFVESIQSCPKDLDLICSDGVISVHRCILMGVSNYFFQLLRDEDMKDTEAITLDNIRRTHLSLALELIYAGATNVKESDKDGVLEVLNLFEIKMRLEHKEATEEDLAMRDTLQQAEIEEEVGDSGTEAQVSKSNAEELELDVIDDDIGATTKDKKDITWVSAAHGTLPEGALMGGYDNGDFLYVARAKHMGDTIPGKLLPRHRVCYIPWRYKEHNKSYYEVLVIPEDQVSWVAASGGSVPPNAIPGGVTIDGETLYVGRAAHELTLAIGKVHPSHGVCYVSYGGGEHHYSEYQVLVKND